MSSVDSNFRSGVNKIFALYEFYASQIGSLLRTIQIDHQLDATVFFNLLSWRLFTTQHVSGVLPSIIRNSTTAVAASGFTFASWL
jgi:hypothetical protein